MNQEHPESEIPDQHKEEGVAEARRLLREFVKKERRREVESGHFLPGITMPEEFDDTQIPEEEILLFPKAYTKTLTEEEYAEYRKGMVDEYGARRKDVNPHRYALFQYIGNRLSRLSAQIE